MSKPPKRRAKAKPAASMVDPATGFYRFAPFKDVLFVEVKRARRYGFPVSLALIELDSLPAGTKAEWRRKLWAGLSVAIKRSLRDTDYPIRYSPERILLLLPHTDLSGAITLSGRLRERAAAVEVRHGRGSYHPTLSIGVSAGIAKEGDFSFGEIVRRAQQALARARSGGGNRVEFETGQPPPQAKDLKPPSSSEGRSVG